jgi:hypothetical protein
MVRILRRDARGREDWAEVSTHRLEARPGRQAGALAQPDQLAQVEIA